MHREREREREIYARYKRISLHERKEVGEEKKKRERKGREGEGCNGGGSLHAREFFHQTSEKEREIEKGRKKRERGERRKGCNLLLPLEQEST